MTWWPDRAKMSCLETQRGMRPEEIGSAGKKNTGGWRNEKGNHPRGRLESEVGRDGSSGGESIGVGVSSRRKEKAVYDSRRRRDATAPSGVGRVQRPSVRGIIEMRASSTLDKRVLCGR